MIAMTTKSSISVNPPRAVDRREQQENTMGASSRRVPGMMRRSDQEASVPSDRELVAASPQHNDRRLMQGEGVASIAGADFPSSIFIPRRRFGGRRRGSAHPDRHDQEVIERASPAA